MPMLHTRMRESWTYSDSGYGHARDAVFNPTRRSWSTPVIDKLRDMEDLLLRLQRWYATQCDSDWEHRFGVRIDTLDNPGWQVRIDLEQTILEGRAFEPIEHGVEKESSNDWHRVWIENGKFQAAGDPSKLAFFLKTFLDWAEA
jgi:hypothetical protein